MSLTWLTTGETAGLLDMSERTIQRQVDRGQYRTRVQEGRGRGGRVYLVALESLPREAQRRYLERYLDEEPETEPEEIGEESAFEPEVKKPMERIHNIAELISKYGQVRADEILSKAASKWLSLVEQAREIKSDPDKVKNRTECLKALAAENGVHYTTLYRKVEGYSNEGILGLVDDRYLAPGEGLEGKVRRAICDEGIRWIRAMCLQIPPPTTTHIYEELKRIAPDRGWNIPSQATVYRIINEILKTEEKMGQRGDREYEAEMMPKVKRDYSHLLYMEEIVGDGHPFDLFVDWHGRAVRPQLSLWQDLRTRKIVGWCIAPTSNSDTLALALRHAIINNGIPARVYTDNGKDYRSQYLSQVYRTLNIEPRFCIPKTPRSKLVERLFKTVHAQFSLYQPGYCGNKPENRPPGFNEKKLLKQNKLLKIEQFVPAFEAYVERYNNQVHSALDDTPENVAQQVPHVNPGRVNVRDLDILLMRRENVLVQDGCIRFMGRDFWSHNIELGRLVGERVQLWYDPNRIGEVLVWYKGKFIGTAENKKALAHGQDRADLAAELREAKQVRRAVKQQIASYTEGLEDILPEEVVKKARRTKRYYPGSEAEGQAPDQEIPRLIGQEKTARQARQVLEQARNQDHDNEPPRQYSRAERMLLERGDRVLAEQSN